MLRPLCCHLCYLPGFLVEILLGQDPSRPPKYPKSWPLDPVVLGWRAVASGTSEVKDPPSASPSDNRKLLQIAGAQCLDPIHKEYVRNRRRVPRSGVSLRVYRQRIQVPGRSSSSWESSQIKVMVIMLILWLSVLQLKTVGPSRASTAQPKR